MVQHLQVHTTVEIRVHLCTLARRSIRHGRVVPSRHVLLHVLPVRRTAKLPPSPPTAPPHSLVRRYTTASLAVVPGGVWKRGLVLRLITARGLFECHKLRLCAADVRAHPAVGQPGANPNSVLLTVTLTNPGTQLFTAIPSHTTVCVCASVDTAAYAYSTAAS